MCTRIFNSYFFNFEIIAFHEEKINVKSMLEKYLMDLFLIQNFYELFKIVYPSANEQWR